MVEILNYLVTVAVALVMIGVVLLVKKAYDVLHEKANNVYDQNRNSKVNELLALVVNNIDDSIKAFLAEYDLSDITEADLEELLDGVKTKVDTLTGDGVIGYLMSVFVDNWDEWLHEKILARVLELRNL